MKNRRYYGLMLSSLVYKSLSFIAVLFALGGLGYMLLEAGENAPTLQAALADWLPRAMVLIIACGLFSITTYILAQLIDVQVSTNDKLNTILERLDQFTEVTTKLKETDRLISVAIERQNRLLTIQSQQNAADPQPTATPVRQSKFDIPVRLVKPDDVEVETD